MFTRIVRANAKLLPLLTALLIQSLPTIARTDNCCGIDRKCSTNAEWVSGYYAFRHGQCGAGDVAAATATNDEASTSNNCCFNGWQCSTDAEWTRGYWAFHRDQCDAQAQAANGNRQRMTSGGSPSASSDQQPRRPPENVAAWIDTSKSADEYELDDGTEIIVVQIKREEMCGIWPSLDYCRYPESYR